ncbi:MAG: DUF2157 domain-containing protein [Saprospiraceae bacterium]
MSKTDHLKWLYKELPDLVSKGILSDESVAKLKGHYGEIDEKPAYDIALLLAAILGAVLIGGGIILLFAHNWDQFSRPVRTLLSFAPLVVAQILYGYVFFKKKDHTAWVEASSAFLMLMLAACIALISQTYHIQGKMEDFLFIWMLLSVPLLYLMNATLPALFYLYGIMSWVMNVPDEMAFGYWLFFMGALPHLVKNMYLDKSVVRSRLLGWTLAFSFPPALIRIIDFDINMITILAIGILISVFYLLGERIYSTKESLIYKPFQTVSVCIAFVLLMFLGYEWPKVRGNMGSAINPNMIAFVIVALIAMGTYCWLTYQDWKSKRRINYFIILLPIILLVGQLLADGGAKTVAIVLANVYLFGFGIYYIKYGIENFRISLVNLGMFFISALIVARFFDTDWGFVVKGLVFIFLGIGFLWINVVLSKRLKARAKVLQS